MSAMSLKLKGMWVPLPTPIKNGEVDIPRMKSVVDHLIEKGVDGMLSLGTSGEFALLNRDERRTVLGAVVEAADGQVPVVAGVSDPATSNVIDFAKDALNIGADGIMSTPPYYYSVDSAGIVEHFRGIHSKVDLPLLVYNIPERTGNLVTPEALRTLAEEGTVVGSKYTGSSLFNLLLYIRECGKRIAIFNGSGELTLPCLEFGGAGSIIAAANVWPEGACSIYDLFMEGKWKEAREAQMSILPVVEAVSVGRPPAALKYAMQLVGEPVGEVKEPLTPLNEREKLEVEDHLRRAGLLRDP
jgi:4-hydroxy-tetrahydrodipicolinate synthase